MSHCTTEGMENGLIADGGADGYGFHSMNHAESPTFLTCLVFITSRMTQVSRILCSLSLLSGFQLAVTHTLVGQVKCHKVQVLI